MIKWYGEHAIVHVNTIVGDRIEKSGKMLRDHIREKLGEVQPTKTYGASRTKVGLEPSAAGEYPKKVTAHLRRNIQAEYDAQIHTARVGTNVLYGKYLELGTSKMARRPWLSKALYETMGAVRGMLGRG